jgi:hypothetical protein
MRRRDVQIFITSAPAALANVLDSQPSFYAPSFRGDAQANAFLPSEGSSSAAASLAISGYSRPNVALANSGFGTDFLAHREKIDVTRHDTPCETLFSAGARRVAPHMRAISAR